MLSESWKDTAREFQALGGVLENAALDKTDKGYGLVATSPGSPAQIFCPKELMIDEHIILAEYGFSTPQEVDSKPAVAGMFVFSYLMSLFNESEKEIESLEMKTPSLFDIDQVLPEYGLRTLASQVGKNAAERFKIFIDRRAVKDGTRRVVAPIWDLINHSSFSAGYSRTKEGLLTFRNDTQDGEILQKYMPKTSPLMLWQHYGFSDRCTSSFSFPFELSVPGTSLKIRCKGKMAGKSQFLMNQNIVEAEVIVIGSISENLVGCQLLKELNKAGIPDQQAQDLINIIIRNNIEERLLLAGRLSDETPDAVQLRKGLELELELIEHSGRKIYV